MSDQTNKCTFCERGLTFPPSLQSLLTNHPNIRPIYLFPRNIPRCKHCDLIFTNKRAIDAELPAPNHTSPVKEVEQQIALARSLISDGIRKEELEAAIPRMQHKLREEIKRRDDVVEKAWEEFKGIWGPEDAPQG
jgi:hypothetical protein